jgi:hypothetical protein
MHNVSDARQIQMHTAESIVPDPSSSEVEISVAKVENCKLPASVKILAEIIQE